MISNIVRSKKNCHVPESIESISFGPPESGSVINCMTSIKNLKKDLIFELASSKLLKKIADPEDLDP
jgi:hypothetical protein